MGRRMATWYAGSAATLLLVASTMLYATMAASLDAEGDEFLRDEVGRLHESLARGGPAPLPGDWPGEDFRIRDASGRVVAASPAAAERLPTRPAFGSVGDDYRTASGRRVRALARRIGDWTYEVAYDRTRELELLERYRRSMVLVLVPALAASTVAGIGIARRGLRPVGQIAATANRIGPDRLDERIVAGNLPAELRDLADTFNVMLDRLQASFARLERFSGDIAHELRTPTHAIRNVAEVALATSRSRAEDREALTACLESAGGLARLIDRLLFLARADDPRTVLELETVDLAAELASICEFYEPLAAQAGVDLAVAAGPALAVRVDRTLVQRAIGNLITNSLAHTPEGGRVTVSAELDAGGLVIAVDDNGSGVAAEHLPSLFDRFYRPDPARSAGQGVGLGLAIVRSIAELHGGRAAIDSTPGRGTRVTIRLPAAGGRT